MPITVLCPQCQSSFSVADKHAGSKIRCPKCKAGAIEVAAARSASPEASFDGELMLKPDDSASSSATSTPPPRRRRRSLANNKGLRGWVGAIMLVGGLVGAAGYAWQLFSHSNMAGMKLPKVGLASVAGGSEFAPKTTSGAAPRSESATLPEQQSPPAASQSSPGTSMSGFVQSPKAIVEEPVDLWKDATRMRSQIQPFEVEFPSDNVIAISEQVDNGTVTYLQRPDPGVIHRETILDQKLTFGFSTIFSVTFLPLQPGETGEDVVHRVAHINPTKSSASGGAIHTLTQYEGFPAIDSKLAPGVQAQYKQPVHMRRLFIMHPTGVYKILAQGTGWKEEELERFITSFHFTDRPGVNGDDVTLIPIAAKHDLAAWPTYNHTGQPDPQGEYISWEAIPLR